MKGLMIEFPSDHRLSCLGIKKNTQGIVVSEPYSKSSPIEIQEVGEVRSITQEASVTCVVVKSGGCLYEDIPVSELELLDD